MKPLFSHLAAVLRHGTKSTKKLLQLDTSESVALNSLYGPGREGSMLG